MALQFLLCLLLQVKAPLQTVVSPIRGVCFNELIAVGFISRWLIQGLLLNK